MQIFKSCCKLDPISRLEHLALPLILLVTGLVLSTVIFFLELAAAKRNHGTQNTSAKAPGNENLMENDIILVN